MHNPRFDYQLPTFGHCPPQLGYLKPYDSSNEPDWSLYADIDDTRPIQVKFEITTLIMEELFSFHAILALILIGTLSTFLIPLSKNWNYYLENLPPVMIALKSSEYHTSLVVSVRVRS